MRVWRVAHNTATYADFPSGPYCSLDTLPDWDSAEVVLEPMFAAHVDDSHMSPYHDSRLGYIRSYERCGFDSREALDEWFSTYHRALADLGFIVYVYEVPSVRTGDCGQVVFDPVHAELIDTETLNVTPVQLELF